MQVATSLAQKEQLVMIAGPTGAGKSFLVRLIEQMIHADLNERMNQDPSWIPVISFEAPPKYEKEIMWKSWYSAALKCLQTPNPMTEFMRTTSLHGPQNRRLSSSLTETQLEVIFLEQLKARGCSCMIIDEAQILLDDEDSLVRNLNVLKSLINRSGMTVVLLGTYKQAQILRRCFEIAFRLWPSA